MAKKKNNKNIKIYSFRFNFMWIWAGIVAAIILYSFFGEGRAVPVAGDWNTVEQMIRQGEVERIKVRLSKPTTQETRIAVSRIYPIRASNSTSQSVRLISSTAT